MIPRRMCVGVLFCQHTRYEQRGVEGASDVRICSRGRNMSITRNSLTVPLGVPTTEVKSI